MSGEQRSRWQAFTKFAFPGRLTSEGVKARRPGLGHFSRRRMLFLISMLTISIGAGIYVRAEIHRRVARFSNNSPGTLARKGGTLFIAGGGQLSNLMYEQFVDLAGRKKAKIVVIPAMEVSEAEYPQYSEPWNSYGVQSVDVLHANSRTKADDPEFSRILDSATGVWLAGGQQSWLTAWYGRTRVETRLKALLARNGVIGGTSAGAAVMSSVMIASGRESPVIGNGFGLIPGAIIDQHFVKRNRFRRLQQALEQHPDLIGFGIDEGTALQYSVESGRFRVIGQSCVVACVPHDESDHRLSFHLEFFNQGDEFDVERLRRGETPPPSSFDLDAILLGE